MKKLSSYASGRWDHRFESCHFDHLGIIQTIKVWVVPFFFSRRTRTKVLRRLENIVVAYRLRKPAALPSPYFLRVRRHKQLSTVYASLTCHLDQKTAENKLFWLVFGCFSIYFPQNLLFSVNHMFAWFLGFLLDFSWLFLNPFENPFSLFPTTQFLRADGCFPPAIALIIIPTNWNLFFSLLYPHHSVSNSDVRLNILRWVGCWFDLFA